MVMRSDDGDERNSGSAVVAAMSTRQYRGAATAGREEDVTETMATVNEVDC